VVVSGLVPLPPNTLRAPVRQPTLYLAGLATNLSWHTHPSSYTNAAIAVRGSSLRKVPRELPPDPDTPRRGRRAIAALHLRHTPRYTYATHHTTPTSGLDKLLRRCYTHPDKGVHT
jgi:hypothetical protein